jgi:hypothetical protein
LWGDARISTSSAVIGLVLSVAQIVTIRERGV